MYLADNLKFLREQKEKSVVDMAAELDMTREKYNSYESGRRTPPLDNIILLAQYWNVSIDLLVKADLKHTNLDSLMKVGSNRLLLPIMVDLKDKDLIEVVPVKSQAGYLKGYTDPEFIEKLSIMKLPFHITGKHRAFPIKGDSMPPLKDGAFVVGKYVESIDEIDNGQTYIVLTKNEGLVYKRLYKKGAEVELHSDNKEYQAFKVKLDDVLEVWRFVCCINLSDKKEEDINMNSLMNMLKDLKVEIESIKK